MKYQSCGWKFQSRQPNNCVKDERLHLRVYIIYVVGPLMDGSFISTATVLGVSQCQKQSTLQWK